MVIEFLSVTNQSLCYLRKMAFITSLLALFLDRENYIVKRPVKKKVWIDLFIVSITFSLDQWSLLHFTFSLEQLSWLRNHIALTLSIWVKITFILDQWSPFHNSCSFIIFWGYILFLFGPVIWHRFTTLLFNWIHLLQ